MIRLARALPLAVGIVLATGTGVASADPPVGVCPGKFFPVDFPSGQGLTQLEKIDKNDDSSVCFLETRGRGCCNIIDNTAARPANRDAGQ